MWVAPSAHADPPHPSPLAALPGVQSSVTLHPTCVAHTPDRLQEALGHAVRRGPHRWDWDLVAAFRAAPSADQLQVLNWALRQAAQAQDDAGRAAPLRLALALLYALPATVRRLPVADPTTADPTAALHLDWLSAAQAKVARHPRAGRSLGTPYFFLA